MSEKNRDSRIAREYHETTKHSEISIRNASHGLDWENKPLAFKTYVSTLPRIKLPIDFDLPGLNALRATGLAAPEQHANSPLTLKKLAQVLFFSAGITRKMKSRIGTYYMRAASATGALYPVELYVVCAKRMDGLDAGIYHFDPKEFTLTLIREGNYLPKLAEIADFNSDILLSQATVIFTSLAWRNAWKYEERSYRHWFWDSGVIAANFLATSLSLGFKSSLLLGFVDEEVDRLLALEEGKEASIALAPIVLPHDIGRTITGSTKTAGMRIDALKTEYLPLSKEEVEYPIIWKMNKASSLRTQLEVSDWVMSSQSILAKAQSFSARAVTRTTCSLQLDNPDSTSPPSLGEVILQRGSTRRFASKEISEKQLSNILYYSTRGIAADFLEQGSTLCDVYLISNAVEGLPSGSYFFNREKKNDSLELLKVGQFRNLSSYLCLEQELFGQASAVLFLMARLDLILGHLGNRGYRAAQLEAGVIAGKIYLSAYAQKIGASGSTFYDDAVEQFFSPHAEGKSAMIAVGVGVPAYSARPGRILAGEGNNNKS